VGLGAADDPAPVVGALAHRGHDDADAVLPVDLLVPGEPLEVAGRARVLVARRRDGRLGLQDRLGLATPRRGRGLERLADLRLLPRIEELLPLVVVEGDRDGGHQAGSGSGAARLRLGLGLGSGRQVRRVVVAVGVVRVVRERATLDQGVGLGLRLDDVDGMGRVVRPVPEDGKELRGLGHRIS
jgi:hypothetical protein